MKNVILTICLTLGTLVAEAGITTYQFTNKNWGSKVGATACDGVTDGWICDLAGYEYMTGRQDAEGRLYSQGVSVKTGTSGAGATSVREFTEVRRVTFNFCQNASDGRGVIYMQVGDNSVDSIVIKKPATSGSGVYLRDSTIVLKIPATGKIRFWITCTKNAINLNSISIRAREGGTNPFTASSFQLVTSVEQLQDSDQIIIGVSKPGVNYIMGYFDETVSQNNIHAIRGKYSVDRTTVDENEDAIYTLRKSVTSKGIEAWYIQDELRYELAYLVASGGQTKNRLALWDKLTDPNTYGDYGYWDIQVAEDGTATIMNLGNSKGKYLQYNAANNPTLFGCYADLSQTAVCLYREIPARGDVPGIAAPMVNFGNVLVRVGHATGERQILVNANRLTEDIQVSLLHGEVFSVNASTVDRDGDYLTISYDAPVGKYLDTLVLKSGDIVEQVSVMLHVVAPITVAEASHMPDYATVYLNDVVVTKKYDQYIFVRDDSGSMLIYDSGDGTGKRYGSGLKNGDVLSGVTGKFNNYFGVPEIAPSQGWSVSGTQECEPEQVTSLDSADVCRYVRIEQVMVDNTYFIELDGQSIQVYDAFNTGIDVGVEETMDAIVFISWDQLQLWIVQQNAATRIEDVQDVRNEQMYNLLGQPADNQYRGVVIRNGIKKLQ